MPVLTVIIVLVVVGFILWLVNNKIPMDATIKLVLNIVVAIIIIIWLLKVFHVWGNIPDVKI